MDRVTRAPTSPFVGLFILLLILPIPPSQSADVRCSVTTAQKVPGSLTRHLDKDCPLEARQTQAIKADEVMEALKSGRHVDLVGVIIEGDLFLDQIPFSPVNPVDVPAGHIRDAIAGGQLTELHQIQGSISIRDSRMQGRIGTRIKEGYVLARGAVTVAGTIFEQPVDFSRAAFVGPVDFSDASFLREGFFIRAIFDQPVTFERTAFGPHTRFHRARFGDEASFRGARFSGLAEFMEVTFGRDASFSRTAFTMGTGFSGSRFAGNLDFSEAQFEREIFFLFTVFEHDVSFRRAIFRNVADFSDAQFKEESDFSEASFRVDPNFMRTKMRTEPPRRSDLDHLGSFYGMATGLAVFMVMVVRVLKRW